MGKNAKASRSAQLRQKREEERLAQLEKKKKEDKIMWMIVAGVALAVLLAVLIPFLVSVLTPPEYHLADSEKYATVEEVTELVKLNITYTANDGRVHNGDIIVALDAENAPITVDNFQTLVKEGFYNGLIFHRVIEGFMIQGGDPKGNGQGGSDTEIKGEFPNNGVDNQLKHERGVISMARLGDQSNPEPYYNTASSQFFIVHKTTPSLDGNYAAFGKVVFGMDMVDGIAAVNVDKDDKPLKSVVINSAVFVKDLAPSSEAEG